MDRNGSLRCAAQSFPISRRRSESATPRSRRVRSRRSRTAFVTASAMLSPVSLASCCASRCASLFLMLRLIKEPFYHHSLPCYLYNRQSERFSAHIRRYPLLAIFYSSDYSSMVELLNDFNHWLVSQLLDNRCELLVPAAETDHTYSHLENSPVTGIAFTG